MKKVLKAAGIAAALAVMIPLSAYAASEAAADQTQQAGSSAQQTGPMDGGYGHRGPGKGFGGFVSQDVLDLLKLDQKTLKEKLASGKTLAQIAEEQGITRDRLKQALTDAFNKRQAEMKQRFADNLDKLVDGKLPQGGKGFKGAFFKKALDLSAVAGKLGMTNEELKLALASGKSIADLAKEKGVDVQTLIDAEKAAIITRINQAVTDGKLTQAQADKQIAKAGEFADKIVNRTGKGFGGKHRGQQAKEDRASAGQEQGAADSQA